MPTDPIPQHLSEVEEAEAQRLYQELCDDIAAGDTWGLTTRTATEDVTMPESTISTSISPRGRVRYRQVQETMEMLRLALIRPLPNAQGSRSGDRYIGEADDDGRSLALVNEFLQIDGVVRIYLADYEMMLFKGDLFDWEPIRSEVLDVLGRYFGAEMIDSPCSPTT